jgi:DNA-binding GntR family transcriptional regulator
LASLVSEGFLEFRKGLGTFVRRDMIDYDVRSLVSFTEKARAAGKKPSTELLTFGKLTAAEMDESLHAALAVKPADELWELDRIRLADGVPVIVPTNPENGFLVSVRDLESLCTPRTSVLILNSPSNPTGGHYAQEALDETESRQQ